MSVTIGVGTCKYHSDVPHLFSYSSLMSNKCCVGGGRSSSFKSRRMSSLRHLCPSFSKVTGGSSLPCPIPIVPREAGLPWHPLAGCLARETWLCLWLRLGAALHAEPTRGCSLLLLGFCTFLPAFSVSLLVLRSFVSFLLHSWVGWFFLPLTYFISSHVALVWKQDFCCHCNSWYKPNSTGHYLLPSIRGRWSPITCTCCSHWSKTLSASCSRSRCFTLKVSCGLSKATLQSIISRLLKTFLPTASRFYLLQ